MVSSTTLIPSIASQRSASAPGRWRPGRPAARPCCAASCGRRARSWPARRGPTNSQLEPVEERPADERRLDRVVERHEQRHDDRDEQQPVPRAAVAAVRRDLFGGAVAPAAGSLRWTSAAPLPGASPGCQPADHPAGTPFGPSCHVHGSVRRRETATSTRPDRSRCSTSAATGSQGHSEAKCATSHSAGPLDSMRFRDRVVLEVAGQEDVGPRRGRRAGQRPAAAAADGDPPHRAARDRPRPAPRRPSPAAPRRPAPANSRRVIGRSSSPTRPSPARGSPSAGSSGTASRRPEDAGERVVDPGVGGPVGVGVRDEQRRAGRGSAGGRGGPSGRRRARRAPGSAAAGGG